MDPNRLQNVYRNPQDELDAMVRALPPSQTPPAMARPVPRPAPQLTPQQRQAILRQQQEQAARAAAQRQQELYRGMTLQQMYQHQRQNGWGAQ